MNEETAMRALRWLGGDDTGTSSKTICAVLSGAGGKVGDPPQDPDDFGRCYRLLKLIPEFRGRLFEVGARLPMWRPMIEAWDELEDRYEQVCEPDGRYTHQSYEREKEHAAAMYKRMFELNEAGHVADGWTNTGAPGCWSKS